MAELDGFTGPLAVNRHADDATVGWNVQTDYGWFLLCDECLAERHMTPYHALQSPVGQECRRGCQCEHVSHFTIE